MIPNNKALVPLERIKTLAQLKTLVKMRRAVKCPYSRCFRGPLPAAFVINLQGAVILSLFESGMYVYQRRS